MGNRKNLIAVGQDEARPSEHDPAATAEAVDYAQESGQEYWEEEAAPRPRFGWVPAFLAVVAVIAWTVFFGWVNARTMQGGASPALWLRWIVDWSVPVVLVVGLWLLAMRHSRREASRFSDAALALARESALLESRLVTVNRELSLARDFIAAQSRDLESLGRVAAERISGSAQHLQDLIRGNGEQVEQIARVSTTARENMDRLRDELPVISNAARDVASQIGHAGNVAQGQIGDLVTGFNRLNEFGQASGRQVALLRAQVDETVVAFEAQMARVEDFATARFGELADRSNAFRAEIDGREVEAFAAMRRRADSLQDEITERQRVLAEQEEAAIATLRERVEQLRSDCAAAAASLGEGQESAAERWAAAIDGLQQRMVEAIRNIAEVDSQALGNAQRRLALLSEEASRVDAAMADRLRVFEEELVRRSEAVSAREADAAEALQQRLATLDATIAQHEQGHLDHVAALATRGEEVAARLADLSVEMERIAGLARDAGAGMDQSTAHLLTRLTLAGGTLEQGRKTMGQLTDESVRLLELIRSSAEHGANDLPQALAAAESRLTSFRDDMQALHELVGETGERSERLAANLQSVRNDGSETWQEIIALEQRLAEIARTAQAVAERTRAELDSSVARLEEVATTHLATLRDEQSEEIRKLADRIGEESGEAIGVALQDHAARAIDALKAAAEEAGAQARETTAHLRDQLARVNELTGNLERRVAHARAKAQEQVDNDFSRRMALITESLNSAAIDISRAFDAEVTDIAWAGYLRGDRGIFTRRAVRLLDTPALRSVSEHYESEREFRESVNRYIHDFEAMLRSVLSTRDGNALAITLLSSDIGKLYVVLAQAIERLRD